MSSRLKWGKDMLGIKSVSVYEPGSKRSERIESFGGQYHVVVLSFLNAIV